jgi:Fe-S cluster biogenesis protein NfuA
MIRPLAAPRFTRRAREALREFAHRHPGEAPVLRVETYQGLEGELEIFLQLLDPADPRKPGEVDRVDSPVSLRFHPATGGQLAEHLIDFVDEEGVRGFRVRPAGPSGSRAPGPSSVPSPVGSHGVPNGGAAPPASADLPAPGSPASRRSLSTLETGVLRELRDHVNPLVACHGGEVRLVRLREDPEADGPVAEVEMKGGCQGCGAARETLQDLVVRILRKGVPELGGVEDVTDHDAGKAPFFRAG